MLGVTRPLRSHGDTITNDLQGDDIVIDKLAEPALTP